MSTMNSAPAEGGTHPPTGLAPSTIRPAQRGLWRVLCLLVCGLFLRAAAEPGFILMNIAGLQGDTITIGDSFTSANYFKLDGLAFGVDRTLSDSAKAGTADITLGVGELQTVKLSKTFDQSSSFLMRKAISGSSIGTVKIYFIRYRTVGGASVPYVYLAYVLDNAFVKSWTVAGEAENVPSETVELWFNKVSMQTAVVKPDGTLAVGQKGEWDNVQSKPWTAAPVVISADNPLPPQ